MKILAIDPGTTNGWASWSEIEGYQSGQTNYRIWPYLDACHSMTPISQLVIEKDQRQHVVSDFSVYEVVGTIKEWAAQNSIPIRWQSPQQAKFYFSDIRLKERGLYKPSYRHANDAMRHLLYYLQFTEGLLREVGRK
jgi:hypothetical protein